MNKETLIQLCNESQWERIIYFASNNGVSDFLEYEIVGKAYRMLRQYDLAIKTFEAGSEISYEGFWKSRFEIQICDCLHLLGEKDQADAGLKLLESMYKIKDNHEKFFILGWRDLQLAKYEDNVEKKEHLLNMARIQLEASVVVGQYDTELRCRLEITVLQQLSELYTANGELNMAAKYANDAQKIAEDAGLQYEMVSNLLMIARLEIARENYSEAEKAAKKVIDANLTDRMISAAQEILEQIK